MSEPFRGALIIGPYRYTLVRVWDDQLPILEWIMLNPSTADAHVDDPTIRRCRGFAADWGFGGIVVKNLFAFRATNPRELTLQTDPIGPRNWSILSSQIGISRTVVAWGAHPMAAAWWKAHPSNPLVSRSELWCLGVTNSGAPRHPLYIKSATDLQIWTP